MDRNATEASVRSFGEPKLPQEAAEPPATACQGEKSLATPPSNSLGEPDMDGLYGAQLCIHAQALRLF